MLGSAAGGELQFQRAEFAPSAESAPASTCFSCGQNINGPHYDLSGQIICSTCANQWEINKKPATQAVLRGTLWGFGAALLGAVIMAVVEGVTGFQFALAAILVGHLVGTAVRKGCSGLGSRRCQWIAVVLTYFGITISYMPGFFRDMETRHPELKAARAQKTASRAPLHAPQAAKTVALGLAAIVVLAASMPFLGLLAGISGILNALIIFFGLSRAWRMTGPDRRILTGPFPVEQSAPANA